MQQNDWQDNLPPAEDFKIQDSYTMDDLISVMAFLRSDKGCPWDREQTHKSLRANLLEEAYEAIDAIDSGRPERLCDELGDVLMQVVFHAQLAMEAGQFTFEDVVASICRKLISRHTHIFGSDQAETAQAVRETWEKNKLAEKGLKNHTQALEDVPISLPALQRSYKIQQKAAQAGFDWDDAVGPKAKIYEELDEIETELNSAHQELRQDRLAGEMGDLLFAAVNYARHLKISPEMALNQTNEKFIRRFRRVEEIAETHGQTLDEMDLAAMDRLWDMAKAEEKAEANLNEIG